MRAQEKKLHNFGQLVILIYGICEAFVRHFNAKYLFLNMILCVNKLGEMIFIMFLSTQLNLTHRLARLRWKRLGVWRIRLEHNYIGPRGWYEQPIDRIELFWPPVQPI